MKTIRIGNGAGFWGDNLDAPRLLAESGGLDYLTLEYLAELTMSILAHQRARDPEAGYVTDFPTVLASLGLALREQPGLRIVTNGGGMNPAAGARAAARMLSDAALDQATIAAVSGDDLLPRLDELIAEGEAFPHFETGAPLGDLRSRIVSANVYLGAGGIVEALAGDARIVMTGRVADASLIVGPAVHEFGWAWNDWTRLGTATVAGHLIECGAQVTGGMFSGWRDTLPLAKIGYPIAVLSEQGDVTITKPADTDGAVTTATVAEQLVYEIGDPAHYLTPDVDADFSSVELDQSAPDHVAVRNAQGRAAPSRLKVSMAYRDGYLASGMLVVCGRNAAAKARAAGEMILERVRRAGFPLARTNVECLGAGDSAPGLPFGSHEPWDIVLRVSAHDPSKEAVERFCREFAPLVTSGPPGITGYTGARPKPHPVLAYWPTTIDRDRVAPQVEIRTAKEWCQPAAK